MAFEHIKYSPETHFRLYFYDAAMRVIALAAESLGGIEPLIEKFAFVQGYINELAENGLEGVSIQESPYWWRSALNDWERQGENIRLPLRDLREAMCLSHDAVLLVIVAGMIEEESRFAEIFKAIHGDLSQPRPTVAILNALFLTEEEENARTIIRRLMHSGLVTAKNTDDAFSNWFVSVPQAIWEAIRGVTAVNPLPWLHFYSIEDVLSLKELYLTPEVASKTSHLPALFVKNEINGLIVRGPRQNGRRTLLSSVARALGYGVLNVQGIEQKDESHWQLLSILATLYHAMPVMGFELSPGETLRIPELSGYHGPWGIALGKQGGFDIPNSRFITIELKMPCNSIRLLHWRKALAGSQSDFDLLSHSFRLSTGNIYRTALLAKSYASLSDSEKVEREHVRMAIRSLNHETLDTLAVYEPSDGNWSQLVCTETTVQELSTLEARSLQRESLAKLVGDTLAKSLNPGVRALFKGPSGCGKTLAARILAAELGMDLYRVELSAVVNKYVGETQKNLYRLFERAEELDVVLLFDEGDALMGKRTSVSSANDRYANLETNFLLQRLESYEGIVIVTTNAADQIDSAFQRRMDIVVDFKAPEPAQRYAIWQLHLPENHLVPEHILQEISHRCAFTGGQIRNAVLHAALLAGTQSSKINIKLLYQSIQREYRKRGAVCPLRVSTLSTVVGEV